MNSAACPLLFFICAYLRVSAFICALGIGIAFERGAAVQSFASQVKFAIQPNGCGSAALSSSALSQSAPPSESG
jgi:hypothetical protein